MRETFIKKIEQLNPLYSCFLDFQRSRTAAQASSGPLADIAISVKDLIDTNFLDTTYGTALFKGNRPTHNAAIVESLLEAGAEIVGKTNLTECGGASYHPDFPLPVNPINKNLWTGISSSGAAGSVAAGLCKVAIGSDTGGSIRTPAACHGLVGFKPSYAKLDTRGMLSFSPNLDHLGIISASVNDTITAFSAISKRSASIGSQKAGFTIGCDLASLARNVSPSVYVHFLETIEMLKGQGFSIRQISFPDVAVLAQGWLDYAAYELVNLSSHDWLKHESEIGEGFLHTLHYGKRITGSRYKEISSEGAAFSESLNRIFADVDFIFTPVLPFEIPGKNFEFDFRKLHNQLQFLAPFNFSGNPTINIPNSYSSSALYANLQIIARKGEDEALLVCARAIEESLKMGRPLNEELP